MTATGASPPTRTDPSSASGRADMSKGTPRLARASRGDLCGCGSFAERPRAQDARDLFAVERLALQQRAREGVQLLDVVHQDLPRAARAVEDDALDLRVDEERGVLAVVLLARDLAAAEDVLLVLAA